MALSAGKSDGSGLQQKQEESQDTWEDSAQQLQILYLNIFRAVPLEAARRGFPHLSYLGNKHQFKC